VVEFSKRDIAELYDLREALEVYAAGKAAEHSLRPSDLATLQDLVKGVLVLRDELLLSGEPRLSPEQMQRFVANDLSFHATLVRSAANRRILKVVADTRVLINIFAMRRTGHSEVVGAVVRKEADLAMRLMGEHIRVSKQERLRDYDEWEYESAISNADTGLAGLVR
jgi:DNA-binding GntR family transcriptional regulator